jgi:hypothetical protein
MHDSALLLIELGALLLLLGLLSRLARRYGLSPIPLYLLAGLLFGHGGLLPLQDIQEFFAVGAEIGVVLLLVMLGLEYSADELVGNLRRAAPAGLIDALLNALPGAAFALLLGWGPVAALVLGGITWISSSGVIAKLLGDLGRLGNRETPVILSILVVEDLAMAFYLPVLSAVLIGAGLAAGSVAVAVALTTVAVVLLVAVRFGHRVSALLSVRRVAGVRSSRRVPGRHRPVRSGGAQRHRVADAVARRVRRRLLRLLRAGHRPTRHSTGAAAGARAGGDHHGHQGAHRLPGRPPGRHRGTWPVADRAGADATGRVLDRDRRAGGGQFRRRAGARPAGHRVRVDHRGDRPGAGADPGCPVVQAPGGQNPPSGTVTSTQLTWSKPPPVLARPPAGGAAASSPGQLVRRPTEKP